jgi:hypothetical protein
VETLNTKSTSLVHVHSCVHCGTKFRRESFEVRALTSGVFHCPRCLHEGPLNVEIRHSLATNLRAAGADLKTAQELLRHANSRITLDIYTRAISANKREANNKVMEMVIEAGKTRLSAPSPAPSRREPHLLEGSKKGAGNSQHPSAPSRATTDLVTVP